METKLFELLINNIQGDRIIRIFSYLILKFYLSKITNSEIAVKMLPVISGNSVKINKRTTLKVIKIYNLIIIGVSIKNIDYKLPVKLVKIVSNSHYYVNKSRIIINMRII